VSPKALKQDERLTRIEDVLRTLLEVRTRDAGRELIDLERQILRIRERLADH
jgi:hypothetical protein